MFSLSLLFGAFIGAFVGAIASTVVIGALVAASRRTPEPPCADCAGALMYPPARAERGCDDCTVRVAHR